MMRQHKLFNLAKFYRFAGLHFSPYLSNPACSQISFIIEIPTPEMGEARVKLLYASVKI